VFFLVDFSARSLVEILLVKVPTERATVTVALNHPWIQSEIEDLKGIYRRKILLEQV
jgi:hypothetical protein